MYERDRGHTSTAVDPDGFAFRTVTERPTDIQKCLDTDGICSPAGIFAGKGRYARSPRRYPIANVRRFDPRSGRFVSLDRFAY